MTTSDDGLLETLGAAGIITAAASVLVVVVGALLASGSARKSTRAARYAAMVATLAAWAEMPYRIRRRAPGDDAAQQVVERMHQLQESAVLDNAELAAECPWLAKRYEHTLNEIRTGTAPFIRQAWDNQPEPNGGGAELAEWGPVGLHDPVIKWRTELRWRYGGRRLIKPVRLATQWIRRPSG
ncbi:MAG TPA: hypothetical protein VE487_10935 [Ilumatobacter sp.]|jgi:hypothetical protein|nr:hypothetical protein [Ilumatobacter sp.]